MPKLVFQYGLPWGLQDKRPANQIGWEPWTHQIGFEIVHFLGPSWWFRLSCRLSDSPSSVSVEDLWRLIAEWWAFSVSYMLSTHIHFSNYMGLYGYPMTYEQNTPHQLYEANFFNTCPSQNIPPTKLHKGGPQASFLAFGAVAHQRCAASLFPPP